MSYDQFPPIEGFLIALKQCPKAALLYAALWQIYLRKPNSKLRLSIKKTDIRRNFQMTKTVFINLLAQLSYCHILVYEDNYEAVYIHFNKFSDTINQGVHPDDYDMDQVSCVSYEKQ
jgi:predicted RNA-binding protein associated with RNAse of E/G family